MNLCESCNWGQFWGGFILVYLFAINFSIKVNIFKLNFNYLVSNLNFLGQFCCLGTQLKVKQKQKFSLFCYKKNFILQINKII